MTWSVNNLFGLEIGKNLQKYSPTRGKPGVDLLFFFWRPTWENTARGHDGLQKKRSTPGFPWVGLYFYKFFPLLQ